MILCFLEQSGVTVIDSFDGLCVSPMACYMSLHDVLTSEPDGNLISCLGEDLGN